jgi:hypothetical protein
VVNTYEAFYTAGLCDAVDLVHIENDHAGLHVLARCRKKAQSMQACMRWSGTEKKKESMPACMHWSVAERRGERASLNALVGWRKRGERASLHALVGCRKKRRPCRRACEREGERGRVRGNVRAQWSTSRRAKCAI